MYTASPTRTPAVPVTTPTAPEGGPVARVGPSLEVLLWLLVVAAAAGWRLIALDAVPAATPEALRARAAWELAHGSSPADWPGDLTAAVAALIVRLGGDGLAWLRLWSALCGVAAVAALALFRPYAGRALSLGAAALVAVSPIAVAAARTLSPDSAALTLGLVALWLVLRLSFDGDRWALPWLAGVAGLALGTGALALAMGAIAALWLAAESTCGDPGVLQHWRAAWRDSATRRRALVLFLIGLLPAVLRFGVGPDRLALAGLYDWSGAASVVPLPWHAPLTLTALYEPPVLVLGVAGALVLVRAWWRDGAAVRPFERLLLVWLVAATMLTVMGLRARPGHLLVLSVPLAFLGVSATSRALPFSARIRLRENGLPLLPVPMLLGFTALRVLAWAKVGAAPPDEMVGVLAVLAAAVVLVGYALHRSWAALPGVLVAAVWLVSGWLLPNGAAAVAFHNGTEPARGPRAAPERAALVQSVQEALAAGRSVSIEGPVAEALAWDLRGRIVPVHIGLAPDVDVAVIRVDAEMGYPATGPGAVTVAERWEPPTLDLLGYVRWLVSRRGWGDVAALRARAVAPSATSQGRDAGP